MKTFFALCLAACAASAAAQEAPKPLGSVKEGVYFAHTQTSTNILELKNGRFRRWTASTLNRGGLRGNPNNLPTREFDSALHTGDYTTNGGTVRFVTPGSARRSFITNEFTFMEFKGKVTLWSAMAQKFWDERKSVFLPGVLEATDRKPEDILEGK